MTPTGHVLLDPPRPTRRRLRRGAALAAGLPLLLAACGAQDDAASTTAAPDLPVIRIGASRDSAAAGLAAPEAAPAAGADDMGVATDKMVAPMQRLVFEAVAGLPALDAPATVYRFDTAGVDVPARLAAIAARLGVPGEVRQLPADQGGGWQVGSADGTGPTIYASASGTLDFGYSSNEPGVGYSCAASEDGAVVDCPEPEPPTGVPSADEARAAAEALFTELGVDLSTYQLDVSADEWGAWVSANLVVGGATAGAAWSLSYGGGGALQYLSGFLATPVAVGDYPTIGTVAAVARLQAQQDQWYVAYPTDPLAADVAIGGGQDGSAGAAAGEVAGDPPVGAETIAPDTGAPDTGAPDTGAPDTGAPDPATTAAPDQATTTVLPADPTIPVTTPNDAPVPDTAAPEPATIPGTLPVDTLPVDTVPVETLPPQTVTFTGVTARLQMVWDVDGVVWLVPSYGFTTDDGGLWDVLAIADGYLDLGDATSPMPLARAGAEPAVVVDPAAADTPVEATAASEG